MKTLKYSKKARFNFIFSAVIILLAMLSVNVPSYASNEKFVRDFKQFTQELEQKRQEQHVPGMAVGIIKAGEVIYSQGFGVSDLEKRSAVTEQTVFGIGSTTKAFTATLIAMLVDEQKVSWDEPVSNYLPYLKFVHQKGYESISLRDMMSHRTGFTRFNMLYANGENQRDDILLQATQAQPWADLREKFLYTNLMVSAAGVAIEKHENSAWETLLEQRILKPLSMKNTSARFTEIIENPHLSQGYMWLSEQQKHKKLSMHDMTNIGPAGAIHSNIEDMMNWLKFQLAEGEFDGKRLLTEAGLNETKKPQISMAKGVDYGLGWIMRQYQGQKLILHEGSIEGYSALVALFPESEIGFVLLTNVTMSPLLGDVLHLVFERFVKPLEPKQSKAYVDTDKDDHIYIGEYEANFASFRDAIFTISQKNNKLYVDVPGQTNYELKAPDAQGKRYFAVTDQVSVTFDKNDRGQVVALRMQQNGMNFELPKKGIDIVAEVDERQLQAYLGTYASEMFKGELQVVIQNHRLALDVPKQMVFELHLPNEQGLRTFRIKNNMSVAFEKQEGNISALKIYKNQELIETAQKIQGDLNSKNQSLPTVADLLKLRNTNKRKKAMIKSKNTQLTGKISMPQSGITGVFTSVFAGHDRYKDVLDFKQYGFIKTAINGDKGAMDMSFADFIELSGKYLKQAQLAHPMALLDWNKYYKNIKVIGQITFNNQSVYEVELINPGFAPSTLLIDSESGDILKLKAHMFNPTLGTLAVETVFENYKEIKGLRIPFKVTSTNEFNGQSIIELDTVNTRVNVDDSFFTLTHQ